MDQRLPILLLLVLFLAAACDPMAPVAPPQQVIVITNTPTLTPTIGATATPRITATPVATETPDATPTPTPFPCETEGTLQEVTEFRSQIAQENLPYNVYLPPCYFETTKRFPYVILIHGATFEQNQWVDLGIVDILNRGIRLGTLPPMVVVMPLYGNIGSENDFTAGGSYENVILDEMIPRIEAELCTINDREHRAIGGISRGGFWAYSIALRNPDIFSAVGSHSGYLPDEQGEVPAAYNPLEIARNSTTLGEIDLRMYLDNGARDDAGINQKLFSDRLVNREIPHTYIINPVGEHNNEYWAAHLEEYLGFYGEEWSRNYDDLPSCMEPSP